MATKSRDDLQRAITLTKYMRALIDLTRDDDIKQAWAILERDERRRTRDVDAIPIQRSRIGPQLAEMVTELEVILSTAKYEDTTDENLARMFERGGSWSLGTKLEVFPPRKIVRAYLIPLQEVPSLVRVSLQIFAFLTIRGDKDLLHRDNDTSGIHYHYVLANRRRTTTIICWDTRWTSVDPTEPKGIRLRPIFHELHGEGKYTKKAQPHKWGQEKRKSVHDACVPDLLKWEIEKFRCASNNAVAVWPVNATLTPRPTQSANKRKKN